MTSSDIAKLAGVSQTAVSLVLGNRWQGRVGRKTAERIMRVADENNYRVNRAASLLKGGKNRNIALAVPDSENPFFSHILHALRQKSIPLGYECMLVETENSYTWYDYIESAVLGGEISYAVNLYNDRIKVNPAISDRIITVNDIHADTPSITIDFKSAIMEAVSLLSEGGYSPILYIAPAIRRTGITKRYDTFVSALEEDGLRGHMLTVSGHMENNVLETLEESKEKISFPCGIILDDDLYAPGVYEFSKRHRLKIGKDMGIISMNDTFISRFLSPPLSSFGYNVDELVSFILDMVKDESTIPPERKEVSMFLNNNRSF